MNTTVTMSYGSLDSLKNAVDDLIGVGIPQEQFFVIKDELPLCHTLLKICPDSAEM